ncbi:HNH endonuclease signature motif containing protein [Streptomyces vinaceus]|uniref:HNH endonuclease signature motif containing protein n=1 Tax=Streptomyces vinaceus TaxID=1960 RepID=UPI0036998C88
MAPRPKYPCIEFDGIPYYLSPHDGHYKRSPNPAWDGKPWLLQRAIWEAEHGPIPPRHRLRFIDGDRTNVTLANLALVAYGSARRSTEFNGYRYQEGPDGYWQASERRGPGAGERLLHRAVWAHAHGPIAEGVHIHHKDGDRANNDLANLEPMAEGDHLRLHKAEPMGASAVDSATRSKQRKAEWAKKEPRTVTCVGCGATFESTGQRAAFCTLPCGKRFRYRQAQASQVAQ